MNEDPDKSQNRSHLKPIVELAKIITDSTVCKINVTDPYSHWTVSCNGKGVKSIPPEESIFSETILQSGAYEIEDLKINPQYKDRTYVKGDPYFRYFCGVRLTTSIGTNIGSICVLDMKSKRISENQKKQLHLLADLVVSNIESENSLSNISAKLNLMRDNLQKLNHDIRNPIYGIVGIADMLLMNKERMNERQNQYIVMIKESAEAMTTIIDGVLMVANADKNKEKLLEKKPLSNIPEKIKRLYTPLVQNKNVTLSLINKMDSGILIPHYLSIILLQIIGNLVSNAIKFTQLEGYVKVILAPGVENNQNMLEIIVKDNGVSMTDDQTSAFNSRKSIAITKGTNGEQGFGIGLQHVINLVTHAGGSISVKRRQQKGTKFSISIPMREGKSKNVAQLDSLTANHLVN